jgi:hypothetical protein
MEDLRSMNNSKMAYFAQEDIFFPILRDVEKIIPDHEINS